MKETKESERESEVHSSVSMWTWSWPCTTFIFFVDSRCARTSLLLWLLIAGAGIYSNIMSWGYNKCLIDVLRVLGVVQTRCGGLFVHHEISFGTPIRQINAVMVKSLT